MINQVDGENTQGDKVTKEDKKSDPSDIEKECELLKKQMKEILAIGRGSYRGRGRGNRGGTANNGK